MKKLSNISKNHIRNPIIHIVNGVKYEIVDSPEYDEEKIIKKFSIILDQKFPYIKSKIPLIIFRKRVKYERDFLGMWMNNSPKTGEYKKIIINSIFDENTKYQEVLETLFHELGHYIWQMYISENAMWEFKKYIYNNTAYISIEALRNIIIKYSYEQIREKFPLIFVIISSLYHKYTPFYITLDLHVFDIENFNMLLQQGRDYESVFIKPVTEYMPDDEEIFCEMFFVYMIYGKKHLNDDNYKILKLILPELK